MSPERDFYTANELNRMGCHVQKSVAIKSFQESMMRPILGLMFRFEKSLRKYHARVRNKNPQLGFFILSFWTVFFNIYISLMNLILENSFFGVNHFVRLIMI